MSVNKVILIGNVGKEPEIKTFGNDNKVASFSLATTESYKDKTGQRVNNTEWHNVVIFGNLTGIVEKYVHKGDKLYIEGKIKTEMYEKDGAKKYVTKIICTQLTMLGSKKIEDGNKTSEVEDLPEEEGDLPF